MVEQEYDTMVRRGPEKGVDFGTIDHSAIMIVPLTYKTGCGFLIILES